MALVTRLEDLCFFHVHLKGGVLEEKIISFKKLFLEMQYVNTFGLRIENEKDLFIIWETHLQLNDFLHTVL